METGQIVMALMLVLSAIYIIVVGRKNSQIISTLRDENLKLNSSNLSLKESNSTKDREIKAFNTSLNNKDIELEQLESTIQDNKITIENLRNKVNSLESKSIKSRTSSQANLSNEEDKKQEERPINKRRTNKKK